MEGTPKPVATVTVTGANSVVVSHPAWQTDFQVVINDVETAMPLILMLLRVGLQVAPLVIPLVA